MRSAQALSRRDIERAIIAKRDTYPPQTECAVCGEMWVAHNGELCPICSICNTHGLRHPEFRDRPIDIVQIRENENYRWVLCQGGATTFLPLLDGDFDG